jgi:hypothetical protein
LSNLQPSIVPLQDGLDLHSPKLIASPGSMLDCLNYEIIDRLGYSRIDGYMRYDGSVSLKDMPEFKVYTTTATMTGIVGAHTNQPIEDADNNIVGFMFSLTPVVAPTSGLAIYVSFTGSANLLNTDCDGVTNMDLYGYTETTITQTQLNALENYLISLVSPLRNRPVGLHWHRHNLYAVVPHVLVKYKATDVNQVVSWVAYGDITNDLNAASGQILDKIVTQAATVALEEEGYFIIRAALDDWGDNVDDDTYLLTGDITVSVGDVYYQADEAKEDLPFNLCGIWMAQRPATYAVSKIYSEPGWVEQGDSFTTTVTLSGICDPFNSIMNQNTDAESTYYFESSGGNSVSAVLLDYFVVSGGFDTGDAVIRLQVRKPALNAGVHELRITTADDMYLEAGTTTKLGDITVNSTLNTLNGYKEMQEVMSRYQFITANFYAAEDMDAWYGVNGTQRAFVFKDGYFSFIYTQDDDDLDIPRHITAYALHLALGYAVGSVLLSVVGEPTNFLGVEGAVEMATGDAVRGLMPLSGTTLGVFCESSIWGIVGNIVDNFQLQVISPNTGCLEYTLVNCGQIVYMDSRGISTLETSANYGDFLGSRLSAPVSSWLLPRCKQGVPGVINTMGVSFAIPIRSKNQYRVFFNDGRILTMTFTVDAEKPVAFTFQKYYYNQATINDTDNRNLLTPFAWTSEIDSAGIERVYVNAKSPYDYYDTNHVFGLEQGNSFDGKYIPHMFETNWFFGDAPIIYTGIQKLRLHGLSRGFTKMNVYAAGMMEDYSFGENVFSTTAESLNLPRTAGNIYNDLLPSTNICNLANRGLGVQLRFKGSNEDLTKPEPGHICQVMVVYSRPGGGPDA